MSLRHYHYFTLKQLIKQQHNTSIRDKVFMTTGFDPGSMATLNADRKFLRAKTVRLALKTN